MDNNLQIFNYENYKIRTVLKNDETWFVAKDVCDVLGIINTTDAVARLDEDEVTRFNLGGQSGESNIIRESGLYSLTLSSKKPEAKPFKRWVTHDVIPSIRKHGMYATDFTIDKILNDPDFGIELLTKLKEERAARIEAERTNAILMHVNKTYTSTEIAKELGMKSAMALNKALTEAKVQYKQNNTWVLYSKYADCGYTEIKQKTLDSGKVVYDRHWTQFGRKFVLELLGMAEVA